MSGLNRIKNCLVSVYHKDNLEPVIRKLKELNVTLYSTGGTQAFIEGLGINVIPVENLTSYPSILGGRVKTLHPKIFGGILGRRENEGDILQLEEYEIPQIDLVIVDLYPFEETAASGAGEQDIIEKIDIGGISLIRAAAKNYKDVVIISSREQYPLLLNLLEEKKGSTALDDRRLLARDAFNISSHYDTAIHNYFSKNETKAFKQSILNAKTLRYGENPHQQGFYYGKLEDVFVQLNGKELSYNNLLDIDSAVSLMAEFDEPAFAIIKHNNACGLASRPRLTDAWTDAFAGDPVSAFGGILVTNTKLDTETATAIHSLFFEVLIAPDYEEQGLQLLKQKTNRIILRQKPFIVPNRNFRSILNGILVQDRDHKTEDRAGLKTVTSAKPSEQEVTDLIFANKIVKHTKSNAIVLVKNKQLLANGVGQTSRVDALKQAVAKAQSFGFNLKGSVMASDAFFPFPDCVEIAHNAGITAVIQPGGSVKDKDSINACNRQGTSMVFTGIRHFKH